MKRHTSRNPARDALLRTVITAIVLRVGAFARSPESKHPRLKATVEQVVSQNQHSPTRISQTS